MYLGIEIGGSKLQIAAGNGTGDPFIGLRRETIDAGAGAGRIREQIVEVTDSLLSELSVMRPDVRGVGIGFGGPIDSASGRVVVSHQVDGWRDFALVDWMRERFGWSAVLHNDADTAAFAEARFGAGRGFDPVLYVTVGSGIGGGLVLDGRIYRGQGAGAVEIGHLRPPMCHLRVPGAGRTVEGIASGFGIESRARTAGRDGGSGRMIAEAAGRGDPFSLDLLADATDTLGWALAQAVTLLNPARIVIGGGVSLIGEALFFEPVRRACRNAIFEPFSGLAEIVPAALGEEVVLFGALALARDALAPPAP